MQYSDSNMKSRVCLITGATSGIGFAAAKELARLESNVTIIGRNKEKCNETVSKIIEYTGNPNVDFILADLSTLSEVRNAAIQFLEKNRKLDVLINNAGVSLGKYQETTEGIEKTIVVNHLSHFLLTNMLLDTIKKSAPSRIINVSSELHRRAQINFDDLYMKNNYRGMKAYGNSKLMNILFTYELSRRLEGTRVAVNAMHPGLVRTNLGGNSGIISKMIWSLITLFAKSAEDGAKTIIYLATEPRIENITGKYFSNEKEVNSSTLSYDEKISERLWSMSKKLTGL
jgi:NAD(P)-dependent dehydrogenase (short-subunit alcohol dehydrogenase family)